ncbi:hypothetical protein P154DRAFT_401150, partial [Amniculicola lignicola CBS 123094]
TPSDSSSPQSSDRPPPTYGYHNTFHTHAQLLNTSNPPTYAIATSNKTLQRLHATARAERSALRDPVPPYTCTVNIGGILGHKQELSSPFQIAATREWGDVYVELCGTQLSIYRIKSSRFFGKHRNGPGRLLRTYSLQHGEVGVASDFKKSALTPKSPFAHLVPASARPKLYETDPHLFETVREFAIRVRLETEQFLLCAKSQEEMLNWVESLCAAIDISMPLEDRSEPRYRSLPRRSRRQRLLDGGRTGVNIENLENEESGRRIIAEQERIIRHFYPHLAGAGLLEQSSTNPPVDPEHDDLDPEDARFPGAMRPASSRVASWNGEELARTASGRPHPTNNTSHDAKNAPPLRHSAAQALRYRRRCAPVLLASSPRVSDVVFTNGERMRISIKQHILVQYTGQPPRYDVHKFPKAPKPLPTIAENRLATGNTSLKVAPTAVVTERPSSLTRGVSGDSVTSSLNEHFGYDLATMSSENTGRGEEGDEIRSVPPSGPPSPTNAQVKMDAAHRLAILGKTRGSEEGARESGLSAVALGVGLLI